MTSELTFGKRREREPAPSERRKTAVGVERRAHPRQAVAWAGRIVVKNLPSVSCAVMNVSARGARLRLRQPIELPSHFSLAIDKAGELPAELLGQDQGVVVRVGFLDDADGVRIRFRHLLAAFRQPAHCA